MWTIIRLSFHRENRSDRREKSFVALENLPFEDSKERSDVVQGTGDGEIVEGTTPLSPLLGAQRHCAVWGHDRSSVRAFLELRADLPSKCEASVLVYVSKECVVNEESLVSTASRVTGVFIMPLSIGVNLRVTGHCNQGGRKYMEDMFSVAFQPTPDDKDLEYAFFGIFDGHGGDEAATFAKEHLMNLIVKQKSFWSDRDEDVLRAIREGYVNTHYAMWRELDKWPRTASGLPSTAGTTASIAFVRKGKIYIGHVGDSGIILGYQVDGDPQWRAKALTEDHKPESGPEMIRIQESGGKVVSKSGVPRVVWNRPRIGHKGPVRRSTHIDEIPFLAVARSLGDLWSYNSELNTFVVSPEPDVKVVAIDVKSHRCLIFGTDGLWNMLTPQTAVAIVQAADRHNEKHLIASQQTCNEQTDIQMWINPSKSLVDRALERWSSTRLRADNTSVVTLMLDPPGPSRSEVLLSQKERVLMHHEIHTPPTTMLAENPQKPNTMNLNIPRPPPVTNNIDFKQPDSSVGIEESKEPPKTENILLLGKPKENLEVSEEPKETVIPTNTNENSETESIQVAEISSSEILEEVVEVDRKEPETLPVDNVEKKNAEDDKGDTIIEKPETIDEKPVDEVTEPQESSTLESTEVEPQLPNVVQQTSFPVARDELKPQLPLTLKQNCELPSDNTALAENEAKSNILNALRRKQHPLFPSARPDIRSVRRSHTLAQHSQGNLLDSVPSEPKTYVTSRLKLRNAKVCSTGTPLEESIKNRVNKSSSGNIGTKRRHSAISQAVVSVEDGCTLQEPCVKRRTRSEDRPNPVDENDPANQTLEDPNSRLSWPVSESNITRPPGVNVSVQERLSSPNTFQRRSLGKKATPVKAIRRPSINGSSRLQQLRGSFGLREWDQGRNNRSNSCSDRKISRTVSIISSTDSTTAPQRWLRSDTYAARPVKTLRSRNVEISGHTMSAQLVHQYGAAKPNRLSLPSKLKQTGNNGSLQSNRVRTSSLPSSKLKQTSNNNGNGNCSTINPTSTGCNSSSGMAKKVKSPYNPSARSLSTRSRIKRLGK